jgi:hypothetical protein
MESIQQHILVAGVPAVVLQRSSQHIPWANCCQKIDPTLAGTCWASPGYPTSSVVAKDLSMIVRLDNQQIVQDQRAEVQVGIPQ